MKEIDRPPSTEASNLIEDILPTREICLDFPELPVFWKQEGNVPKLEVNFRRRFFLMELRADRADGTTANMSYSDRTGAPRLQEAEGYG
jgi:hypothetical protein